MPNIYRIASDALGAQDTIIQHQITRASMSSARVEIKCFMYGIHSTSSPAHTHTHTCGTRRVTVCMHQEVLWRVYMNTQTRF